MFSFTSSSNSTSATRLITPSLWTRQISDARRQPDRADVTPFHVRRSSRGSCRSQACHRRSEDRQIPCPWSFTPTFLSSPCGSKSTDRLLQVFVYSHYGTFYSIITLTHAPTQAALPGWRALPRAPARNPAEKASPVPFAATPARPPAHAGPGSTPTGYSSELQVLRLCGWHFKGSQWCRSFCNNFFFLKFYFF